MDMVNSLKHTLDNQNGFVLGASILISAILLLTGVLFGLSVALDQFDFTRRWTGWLLGWPRHAAEAAGGQEGSGIAFFFLHTLNFVYLYILAAVILWRWGRRRG